MKLWSIYFTGHYPVGAVAVVIAETAHEAILKFLSELRLKEPYLSKDISNDYETLKDRCKQITQPVTILLNGEY